MRIQLAGDVHAPALAREFVRRQLHDVLARGQRPVCDDVELIVSELVTNSVRAGATVIDLMLEVLSEAVEVQVTDDAAGWPTPRSAGPDGLDGRGLEIVDRLADHWHTVASPPGKRVVVTRGHQLA